jgi:hypothetical protein
MFWSFKAKYTVFSWVIYTLFTQRNMIESYGVKICANYFSDWGNYSFMWCGNTVWIFVHTDSTMWFHDEYSDLNSCWYNFNQSIIFIEKVMWQHGTDVHAYGLCMYSLMNTSKISSWHNFHQCTISVENTTVVECDVGMDVHANGLHHDYLINIEMRMSLDKILTDGKHNVA